MHQAHEVLWGEGKLEGGHFLHDVVPVAGTVFPVIIAASSYIKL